MVIDFHLLTECASMNIVGYKLLHLGPVVCASDLFQSVEYARVGAYSDIMMKS